MKQMSFLTISAASGKTDLHFIEKMIFGWVGVRFSFKESTMYNRMISMGMSS